MINSSFYLFCFISNCQLVLDSDKTIFDTFLFSIDDLDDLCISYQFARGRSSWPHGGHSLIWPIRGRAAGQGMVFGLLCPEQGIQFYANLP